MSKRIIGSNVQLGDSYRLPDNGNLDFLTETDEGYKLKKMMEQMRKDAVEQAQITVNNAKVQAQQIIEQAKEVERQIETLKNAELEQARQQGFKSGFAEGAEIAGKEIYAKVANLQTLANASFDMKKEIILSAEQEILQLSIAVAERILKQQLELKPEMVNKIIKAAVLELNDKEEVKIIVNPALKDQLYEFSDELKSLIKGMKTVKIVEDKTINPDSAIVESLESRIDARLEAQIAEVTRELMKSFAEEPVVKSILDKKAAEDNKE